MKQTQQIYHAFASWRVRLHSSVKPRLSVRFFRRSRNHSLIWNFVMQGHYEGHPRSVGACEEVAAWSRPTTRKLLNEARIKGFIDIRPDPADHRRRLVSPTPLTVSEYESMVSGYIQFVKTLDRK
jgi:hypothetical protein